MHTGRFYLIATFIVLTASAFTLADAARWNLTDNYEIRFTSDDPSGIFTDLKGDIFFDANNLNASTFNMVVKVNSINTGNGMQNSHAKSAKWFDAETYPDIRFTSKSINKTSNGFSTTGILEMHGVKKEITFPFTFENNIFKGNFEVNRNDYKIGEPGGSASDVLKVALKVPVSK